MTLDEIKQNPNTLRIYNDRVKLKKENGGYAACCPFHDDNNPSFKMHLKDGKWLWSCFACGFKDNSVLDFIMKFDKVDFNTAAKKAKEELGSWEEGKNVEKTFKAVGEKKTYQTFSIEEIKVFEELLRESRAGRDFLKSRGIVYETAQKLHFGFKDGRLVLPCIHNGRVISIEYRDITKKEFSRHPGMATTLFNVDCIDPLEPVFVTEGKLDAAILVQFGFRAVSIPGASYSLTPEMKDVLKSASEIILAGDSDVPGRESMTKLWNELGENTYLLEWENAKDANEAFLNYKGKSFGDYVDGLMKLARIRPMRSVYSLIEQMESGDKLRLVDHPHRFHAPWPTVDKMSTILPGSVVGISGTNTGVGKTTFITNAEVYEARKYGETVLFYSGELTPDEMVNLVAASELNKDRTKIQLLDYKLAAKRLSGVNFLIGFDPDLSTIDPVLDLIEKAIKRFGASRVVLDHFHYFTAGAEAKDEAAAAQRIKNIAQKYGVIFFVLAQPRKALATLKGKSIHLTDIKGSEAVVSTSNAFFTIHRETASNLDDSKTPTDPYRPETIIQLIKGRSLAGGPVFAKLECQGVNAKFVELAPKEIEETLDMPF